MCATATRERLALPAELQGGVKWDNVRPVDPGEEKEVLDTFALDSRVTATGFQSHGTKKDGTPRFVCRRRDVRFLTDRAIEPLCLLAQGRSMEDVARFGSTSVEEIIRLVRRMEKIHNVPLSGLRKINLTYPVEELPTQIRESAIRGAKLAAPARR